MEQIFFFSLLSRILRLEGKPCQLSPCGPVPRLAWPGSGPERRAVPELVCLPNFPLSVAEAVGLMPPTESALQRSAGAAVHAVTLPASSKVPAQSHGAVCASPTQRSSCRDAASEQSKLGGVLQCRHAAATRKPWLATSAKSSEELIEAGYTIAPQVLKRRNNESIASTPTVRSRASTPPVQEAAGSAVDLMQDIAVDPDFHFFQDFDCMVLR